MSDLEEKLRRHVQKGLNAPRVCANTKTDKITIAFTTDTIVHSSRNLGVDPPVTPKGRLRSKAPTCQGMQFHLECGCNPEVTMHTFENILWRYNLTREQFWKDPSLLETLRCYTHGPSAVKKCESALIRDPRRWDINRSWAARHGRLPYLKI